MTKPGNWGNGWTTTGIRVCPELSSCGRPWPMFSLTARSPRKKQQKAVERVLPAELRRQAKERRQAIENLEKARSRAEKTAQTDKERGLRELNRPVSSANFMVAGVTYEGRDAVVDRFASVGGHVFLVREPANPYDRNAIEVRLQNGMQIGYVPREDAAYLAPGFDQGDKHEARITKILNGRRAPIPVVQAHLYRSEATVQGPVTQSQIAPRAVPVVPAPAGCGCASGLMAVVVFAVVCVIFLVVIAQ